MAGMTEPTSAGAGGLFAWKLLGGLAGIAAIAAGLAAIVVMCITPPREPREWAVGLICTVMGSVCGGAAFIQHYGMAHWADTYFGTMGLVGILFVCGLPAWAVVRWVFNYIIRRRDLDIAAIAADLHKLRGGQ